MPNVRFKVRTQRRPAQFSRVAIFSNGSKSRFQETSQRVQVMFKAKYIYKNYAFSIFASQKDNRIETCTVGPHFFETMCPTAFLAPTLTAKTCFICAQPQNAFFLAKLALQGNRSNGKKSFPGRVPGPKKRTKMVPKSGPFQKEFFCSAA